MDTDNKLVNGLGITFVGFALIALILFQFSLLKSTQREHEQRLKAIETKIGIIGETKDE